MSTPECYVIRHVNDEEDLKSLEVELDGALNAQTDIIIIEPARLGKETARWISVGNFLHKGSVVCGVTACIASFITDRLKVLVPLGLSSFICAGVYMISWQFDPCCKYQVAKHIDSSVVPLHRLKVTDPVILVRKDDKRRKILHTVLAMLSLSICLRKLYKSRS
ncbi:TMEM11 [Bugula neritina]|uniref:TMEM11 n=1 Tax=Bugula neritina TaxID=10212 RepID=A0A7J7KK17_BUGNE|nr:TMEM11 [Bugula neritina]